MYIIDFIEICRDDFVIDVGDADKDDALYSEGSVSYANDDVTDSVAASPPAAAAVNVASDDDDDDVEAFTRKTMRLLEMEVEMKHQSFRLV